MVNDTTTQPTPSNTSAARAPGEIRGHTSDVVFESLLRLRPENLPKELRQFRPQIAFYRIRQALNAVIEETFENTDTSKLHYKHLRLVPVSDVLYSRTRRLEGDRIDPTGDLIHVLTYPDKFVAYVESGDESAVIQVPPPPMNNAEENTEAGFCHLVFEALQATFGHGDTDDTSEAPRAARRRNVLKGDAAVFAWAFGVRWYANVRHPQRKDCKVMTGTPAGATYDLVRPWLDIRETHRKPIRKKERYSRAVCADCGLKILVRGEAAHEMQSYFGPYGHAPHTAWCKFLLCIECVRTRVDQTFTTSPPHPEDPPTKS